MEIEPTLWHAAETARHAPSIFETRPWKWRVGPAALRLYADRTKQLMVADRDGRLLTISCGAALHHARVALAVSGRRAIVDRMPDPANADLLAEIRLAGLHPIQQHDLDAYTSIGRAHRFTPHRDAALTQAQADLLTAAVRRQGARLHLMCDEHIAALNRTVQVATQVAATVGRGGVAQLQRIDADTVTAPGAGARFGLIFTDEDSTKSWLRTGEALSALLLASTAAGVSCEPVGEPSRLPISGLHAQRLLPGLGHPQLAIQIGQSR